MTRKRTPLKDSASKKSTDRSIMLSPRRARSQDESAMANDDVPQRVAAMNTVSPSSSSGPGGIIDLKRGRRSRRRRRSRSGGRRKRSSSRRSRRRSRSRNTGGNESDYDENDDSTTTQEDDEDDYSTTDQEAGDAGYRRRRRRSRRSRRGRSRSRRRPILGGIDTEETSEELTDDVSTSDGSVDLMTARRGRKRRMRRRSKTPMSTLSKRRNGQYSDQEGESTGEMSDALTTHSDDMVMARRGRSRRRRRGSRR